MSRKLLTLWFCITAAATVGTARQATRAPAPSAALTPCPRGSVPAECGSVTVFEDRAAARGRTIPIHFEVVRADHAATEAVFLLAGGPGEGSTDMVGAANGYLRVLRSALDLVYIDQRGTGQSHPLACDEIDLSQPAGAFGHVFDPARVDACRAALSRDADLTKYTTDDAVRDMEDVRARLGYERISLVGTSYGTRLAQAYLRRFPSRVRSVVIDGVVPFDLVIPLTYAASAQRAVDAVFAGCLADERCAAAHPHPADDFRAVLQRFDAGPVTASVPARGTSVPVRMSRGDFGYAVRGMLYAGGISRLPDVLGRAVASGDVSEFATFYWNRAASMNRSLAYGMHLSVFCAEDVPYAADADIAPATAGTFLGRYLFDEYRAACREWPRAAIAADARRPVIARAPVLLVSGSLDPVTPPAFAERVARSLPLTRLVTSPVSGHGSAGGCPRAAVLYVLEHGTLDGAPDVCR